MYHQKPNKNNIKWQKQTSLQKLKRKINQKKTNLCDIHKEISTKQYLRNTSELRI